MHAKAGELFRDQGGSDVFERRKLLGEGRTGDVHLVLDAREPEEKLLLQLRVAAVTRVRPNAYALKVAREQPGESLVWRNARITHEQGALERLVHPGIVRSGTVGWHEGRAYFTMEVLEGPSLRQFLRGKQHSYRELMTLFAGFCEAMAQCHEKGIVHRDLRPGNLTVEPTRGLVLFDFESCAPSFLEESSTGGAGAAEYACPEYLAYVLDASVSYVNHPRGDVYAMGVTLSAFLTGRMHVVRGPEDVAEYLRRLRDVKHVSPVDVNPEAPPACAALALRLLSKDGPTSARELPELVRDAMAQDAAVLDGLAPRSEADAETLLSSVRIPPRRFVSAPRRLRRLWDTGHRLARRHAFRAAVITFFAAVQWMAWSTVFQIRANLILNARLTEASRVLVVNNAVLAQVVAQMKAQLAAVPQRPAAVAVQEVIVAARKMPEKPEPQWFKPAADGVCRDPSTGERLQGAVAVRGACWRVGGKIHPTDLCPEGWFDAPPEVDSEPRLQHLRNHCFDPMNIPREPKATNPGKP